MKIVKKVLIVLAVALVIIQFFGVKKNQNPGKAANPVAKQFILSPDVENILKTSCYDCHSNNTVYPWYTYIQPIGWWMQHHVDEGKGELNFDEFAAYTPRRQYHKLEETEEMVAGGDMPLSSYTIMHGNAMLSASQKEALISWSKTIREEIKAKNPGSASPGGKRKD